MQLKNCLNNILLKFLAAFILLGCGSKGQLNRIEHFYGLKPTRIIWLQVPGLDEEYLSILKFYAKNTDEKNEFENFHCLGKMWNFNISELRPNSGTSFISQMTGQNNLSGQCSDYSLKPLWKIEERVRYKVGYFSDDLKDTLCSHEKKVFFDGVTRWYMHEKPKQTGNYFHADEMTTFKDGDIFYDRSCDKDQCFRSFDHNIKNTFSRFIYGKSFYFYIARIHELEGLIKGKRVDKVHEFLKKLDGLLSYFKSKVEGKQDALILLTSAASRGVELPREGSNWKDKLSRKRDVYYRRSQTQSLVMAYGARSESFCGLYHQSEIPKRVLTSPSL